MPGEVRGLQYIHEHYGVLPWSTLLRPAIQLAQDGFTVSDDFAKAMDISTTTYDFLTNDPVWAIDFAPNGTRVGVGDTMTRKRYARTLEAIAKTPDEFYTGSLAGATIETIQETNGTMTLKDLEAYTVVSRSPVEIDYNGYHLYACGAPASGAVVLSIMKILEGYDALGTEAVNLSTHRMDEAMKFGYGRVGAAVPSLRNRTVDNIRGQA